MAVMVKRSYFCAFTYPTLRATFSADESNCHVVTVAGGRILAMDTVAGPERLRRLDLAVLDHR